MSAYLVTGGSGFIGRRIVRYLEEQGHEVTITSRAPVPGHRTILADLGRGELDLRAERFLHVCHVAGLAHLEPRTREEAERFTIVNVGGTQTLLRALEHCRERPRSLLLVSTMAVYGARVGEGLDESTERRAADPYGQSKRQAEDLVLGWGERHGVRTAILRLPLVVGPGVSGNLGRMVSAIAAGRYLGVGRSMARRSVVRLTDVAHILPKALEVGGVFHLTDGYHPSFAELEASLAAALGRRMPLHLPTPLARAAAVTGDLIEATTRRRMPFNRSTMAKMTSTLTFSDEKARRVLGWRPTRVLDHIDELLRADGMVDAALSRLPAPAPDVSPRRRHSLPPAPSAATPTAVIVVNYECGAFLARSVRSALASTVPVEVLVVDNASRDTSLAILEETVGHDPRVRVVRNATNLGFAAGVNQGLACTSSPFVLLLNPDAVVEADTITRLLEAMRAHPDAGISGGRVLNPDGTEQPGCRRAFPSLGPAFVRAFGLWRMGPRWKKRDFVHAGDPLPPGPTDVDAVSGAFMFVRRTAMEAVGPMDEGYMLHCEDLDWCVRFRSAGWRVLFVPDASVLHERGVSSRVRPLFVLWHKHLGMMRFYRKFLRTRYPAPVYFLVAGGVALRFVFLASLVTAGRFRRRRHRLPGPAVPTTWPPSP